MIVKGLLKLFYSRIIKCLGQVKRPSVILLESELNLSSLFLNVKHVEVIKLCNNGPIATSFEWGNVRAFIYY